VNQNQESTSAHVEVSGEWKKDQEDMGVSAAEWCRRMIRLGRRQYGLPYDPDEIPEMNGLKTENDEKGDSDHFREFLIANLSTDQYLSMDDLIEIMEEQVNETGDELEAAGIVETSIGKGYKLSDDWRGSDEDA
jgi:hypothetical protein